MNKVFRVIWSESQGAWVAVSEVVKSHSKRSRKAALALALAAGGLMGVTGYASATALGEHNPNIGVGSIVIGPAADCNPAAATGDRSVSIGCETGAFAVGNHQTNLGYQAGRSSEGNYNTALGSNSGENVTGDNNTAVGLSSGGSVKGNDNAAVGSNAGGSVTGNNNAAVGSNAGGSVTGNNNLSFGSSAGGSTKGNANVAVGFGAGANLKGHNNSSLGRDAGKAVDGDDNAAFGSNAGEGVKGDLNTGFGRSAGKGVQGSSNTSLGDGAGMSQRGNGNLSAGLSAGQGVYGDHNVMLGNKALTVGSSAATPISRTVVIGSEAKAYFDDTVALGSNAKAEHKNSVALGHASQTADAAKVDSAVINTEVDGKTGTFTYSGFEGIASGVVSVGSAGAERQIINVAPGAITGTSTDAINGSQLFSVATGINTDMYIQGNSVAQALGGDSKYEGGKVTADLTVGGNRYTTVQDALNNISTAGGWNVATSDSSTTASKVAPGAKVDFVSSDNNVAIKHTRDADDNTSIDFALSNDLTLGVDGKDGTDGKIAVNGKDGVSGVTIDGKDGSIGLTGPAGANGISPTLTMRPDIKLGDVINNTNSITRITYKDADGNDATLATLENDGLRFSGNDNPVAGYVTRNLNQEMQIKGGATIAGSYSSANIKTVATQDGGIEIQIADSPKFGDITINNAGKISGVEAGVDGKDAVNVSQLESVKDVADNANKGWNVSVDGGTEHNVAPGAGVDFNGGKNIELTQNGGEITISTADKVEFDNVKVGDVTINKETGITVGETTIDKDGVKVGDVAITTGGIHAGDNKITGVAEGTIAAGSKDAVNGGQIHDMQVEINKQAGGWELTDGQGGKQQVKAGDTVAIVGGDNINVEFDADGKMVVETTPDVTHNSVTTGDTVMNDNGVTITGGPSITKDGVDAGDKKITSVAKGDISETSTDAINGSQLNDTNNRVTVNEGNIKNIQEGKDGMFQVSQDYNAPAPKPTGKKSAAGGAGAVASGDNSTAIGNDAKATASNSTALGNSASASANNSVALGHGSVADRANSVSVGSVGNERQITNVAKGEVSATSTDAINGSQLHELGGVVNQYFNATNKRIDRVDNNARAGIAGAVAASTLPQSSLPGKSMLTLGGATYRGETALAIGVSRLSDNSRTVIKASGTADSRGNASVGVGAGWHW